MKDKFIASLVCQWPIFLFMILAYLNMSLAFKIADPNDFVIFTKIALVVNMIALTISIMFYAHHYYAPAPLKYEYPVLRKKYAYIGLSCIVCWVYVLLFVFDLRHWGILTGIEIL